MSRVNDWIQGELVGFADLNKENEAMFEFASAFSSILIGLADMNSTPSAAINPLTIAVQPPYGVAIGGPTQCCVIGGRIANEIPSTALSFPPNASGAIRSDAIAAQFYELDVNPFQRSVRQPDTTVVDTTVYEKAQALRFQVVPGTGGAGNFGVCPPGWSPVARVDVPPNNAPLDASMVSVTLPTFLSVLAALTVSALNGVHGNVSLVCPDGSIIISANPGAGIVQLQAAAAAASVTRLNGLQGAVTVACPDGTIIVTQVGNAINLRAVVASAVTSVNAQQGAVTILQGPGVIVDTIAYGGGQAIRVSIADPHPVGSVFIRRQRIVDFKAITLTLPTLPPGNYLITAHGSASVLQCHLFLTLSGCAGAEGQQVNGPARADAISYVEIIGRAVGGQAPAVNLTFDNPAGTAFEMGNLLEIMAVRDS